VHEVRGGVQEHYCGSSRWDGQETGIGAPPTARHAGVVQDAANLL